MINSFSLSFTVSLSLLFLLHCSLLKYCVTKKFCTLGFKLFFGFGQITFKMGGIQREMSGTVTVPGRPSFRSHHGGDVHAD